MELKKLLHRLTASTETLDEERLRDFCSSRPGVTCISQVEPREHRTVAGEIKTVRIVPRPHGSPWLEATITDGTGYLVARWTGRRRIAGVKSGQRLLVSGRGSRTGPGGRLLLVNPQYELLESSGH